MRQRGDHRLKPTCHDWLTFVRPHLPEVLVSPPAFERLRKAALQLPGDALTALEIRLAPGVEAVDLSVKISRPQDLPDALFSPELQRIFQRWSAGHLPSVVSLWLELDLGHAAKGLPDPVLCVELDRGADPVPTLSAVFPALDERQRALALHCLGEIPPPARLLYLFDLRARGTRALRLEILGLGPDAASAYLERVAPSLASAVADAAPLLAGAERPHLSFDIEPGGIGQRAGLEGSFVKWPHREPRWRELFDRLVDRGLCTLVKRDAVFAWPGQETFWSAPVRWPAAAAGTRGACVRALSHVKIVARPDHAPEAKAYLLFEWLEKSLGAAG